MPTRLRAHEAFCEALKSLRAYKCGHVASVASSQLSDQILELAADVASRRS